MTANYSASGPFTNPDAMMAAAHLVQRDWGSTGYALAACGERGRVTVFEVAHFDGSRFNIAADRWGNAQSLSDDPETAKAELAAMRANAIAV